MRILFPTSECAPFAKTGGLADVAGALPDALKRFGHEVHVVMPLYQQTRQIGLPFRSTKLKLRVPLGPETVVADVFEADFPGGSVLHLLQYDPFFNRTELYRTAEGDYPDNHRRFTFLCRATLELGKALGGPWDVVHCHDWHTGLVPAYVQSLYRKDPAFARTRSLLTIHNLAYQGVFAPEALEFTGLPRSMFTPTGLEFWGRLNFLKAGLVYSDRLNTVSPTYAQEIQTPELGCGLDGVLRARREDLSGILNGIDYTVWDPWTDPRITIHFKADRLPRKQELKHRLLEDQRMFPIEGAPLLGIISRLEDQKGFDLIAEIGEKLLQLNLQLVVLGTGSRRYHEAFLRLKADHPRKLAINLTFDEELAHQIYAGADMFLMPSRYEPCGLGQLISMRYGTVPLVRHTGGLADTVFDFDGRNGNGFSFQNYSADALFLTIKRALETYQNPELWGRVVRNGMASDHSWERTALEYDALYRRLADGNPA
jgi:starch synthase